jgi:hypothetical protein
MITQGKAHYSGLKDWSSALFFDCINTRYTTSSHRKIQRLLYRRTARSGVSQLKPFDLKDSPKREFVRGHFELQTVLFRTRLTFSCPTESFRRGLLLCQEKSKRRQTRQAFTPGLFQAKLPPALALPSTMGTRPIRTHTPVPAALPRAPDEPSPLVDSGIH